MSTCEAETEDIDGLVDLGTATKRLGLAGRANHSGNVSTDTYQEHDLQWRERRFRCAALLEDGEEATLAGCAVSSTWSEGV